MNIVGGKRIRIFFLAKALLLLELGTLQKHFKNLHSNKVKRITINQ